MKTRQVNYNSYFYGLFNGCLFGAMYILLVAPDVNLALTWSFWGFISTCLIAGVYFFLKIPPKEKRLDIPRAKATKYNFDSSKNEYANNLKRIQKLNKINKNENTKI